MGDIKQEQVPWSQAVVMVCTKCSKKIAGDERLADDLKKELKGDFKDLRGKAIRVVTASCLDVCPKNRLTVAVAPRAGETRTLTFEPDTKKSELISEILKTPGL